VFTGVAGTPWYSNLYFTWVSGTEATALAEVGDFWTEVLNGIGTAVSGVVEGDIPVIDDATGNIQFMESTADESLNFTGSGNVLPPANQGLINALTDTFLNGRRLRGKVFVPGLVSSAANADGTVATIYRTLFATMGTNLIAATSSPGPWRIYSPTHGTSAVVSSVSSPASFAVMRSRRD